jgi:hypothetical protein
MMCDRMTAGSRMQANNAIAFNSSGLAGVAAGQPCQTSHATSVRENSVEALVAGSGNHPERREIYSR